MSFLELGGRTFIFGLSDARIALKLGGTGESVWQG